MSRADLGLLRLAVLRQAVLDRCTCEGRPRDLAEPHDPDCSLQNTGWLS